MTLNSKPQQRPAPVVGALPALARYLNRGFPRSYWLATAVPRLLAGLYWQRQARSRKLGKPLRSLDLTGLKTSDTVFVLATGASINEYPESHWDTVARHDSIGMNFFMLHEFVPDLYVMENMEELHRSLLAMRADDYADVPVILKTSLSNLSPRRVRTRLRKIGMNPSHVRDRFYMSQDLLAAGTDLKQTHDAYRLMRRLGLFKVRPRVSVLTKRRGSISYVVNLAVRMGYREIILCGVDLSHPEHFYDSRRDQLEAAGYPVPPSSPRDGVHLTNDPEKNQVTIHDVLLAMDAEVLRPMGIRLHVGHPSSALHPDFPVYQWPEPDAE